jgi:2-amino-4-hydroxy-6-hydroxymethyldihydropteridine diphosphokinase
MILIAIGANLPGRDRKTPLQTCHEAVEALHLLPNLKVHRVSNWWRTAPIPVSDQPDFVNGVVGLLGTLKPELLLEKLHNIEDSFGRQRLTVNSARTLDLDIIAMGETIRSAPNPVLPHPRAHERAFVLRPLLEIAPNWIHPVTKQTARNLLANLPGQQCCRI